MKAAAWVLGLVAFGGLIVLSVAGLTAAVGILVTAAALVGMIALGSLLGGRTTPNRSPYGAEPAAHEDSAEGTRRDATGTSSAATPTPPGSRPSGGDDTGPAQSDETGGTGSAGAAGP